MTNEQREIYLFLCMTGRELEAVEYRERCESRKEEQGHEDGK